MSDQGAAIRIEQDKGGQAPCPLNKSERNLVETSPIPFSSHEVHNCFVHR